MTETSTPENEIETYGALQDKVPQAPPRSQWRDVWDQFRKHKGAVAKPFGTQAIQIPEVFENLGVQMVTAVEPQIAMIEKQIATSPTGTSV